jgi:hypothetical protein
MGEGNKSAQTRRPASPNGFAGQAPLLRYEGAERAAPSVAAKQRSLVPLAGSARVRKIKGLSRVLSRDVSIEASKEFLARVPFKPVEHSVYFGRERLGRYSRVASHLYAAFDAQDRLLGQFKQQRMAYVAVSWAAHLKS